MTSILDITVEEAATSLAAQGYTENHLGCKLATKRPSHQNGYCKCKIHGSGQRAEFYLHQLAVVASGRGAELRDAMHAGSHECSHICRNPSCFNADHIVVEPREVNKARNFCVRLQCGCGGFVSNCTHVPACLF